MSKSVVAFSDLWMVFHPSERCEPPKNVPPLPYYMHPNCAVCNYMFCYDYRFILVYCRCETPPMLCHQCQSVNGKSVALCRWCGSYSGKETVRSRDINIYRQFFLFGMWNSYARTNPDPQKMINWGTFLNEIRSIKPFIQSQAERNMSFTEFMRESKHNIRMYMMCMRGVPHSLRDLHTNVVEKTKGFLSRNQSMTSKSRIDFVTANLMKFTANRLILPILEYSPTSEKILMKMWETIFLRIVFTKHVRNSQKILKIVEKL